MCLGSKKSKSSALAPSAAPAQQARNDEKERQDRINSAVTALNAALNNPGRFSQRQQVGRNVTDLNMRQLRKAREATGRDATFSLARRGLSGGSADVDTQAEIVDRFNEGTLQATQLGQAAEAAALAEDERIRQSFTGQIQGGLSQGDAVSAALQQSTANLANLESQANINAAGGQSGTIYQTLGNVFSAINDRLAARDALAGRQAARTRYPSYASLNPGAGSAGSITGL